MKLVPTFGALVLVLGCSAPTGGGDVAGTAGGKGDHPANGTYPATIKAYEIVLHPDASEEVQRVTVEPMEGQVRVSWSSKLDNDPIVLDGQGEARVELPSGEDMIQYEIGTGTDFLECDTSYVYNEDGDSGSYAVPMFVWTDVHTGERYCDFDPTGDVDVVLSTSVLERLIPGFERYGDEALKEEVAEKVTLRPLGAAIAVETHVAPKIEEVFEGTNFALPDPLVWIRGHDGRSESEKGPIEAVEVSFQSRIGAFISDGAYEVHLEGLDCYPGAGDRQALVGTYHPREPGSVVPETTVRVAGSTHYDCAIRPEDQ